MANAGPNTNGSQVQCEAGRKQQAPAAQHLLRPGSPIYLPSLCVVLHHHRGDALAVSHACCALCHAAQPAMTDTCPSAPPPPLPGMCCRDGRHVVFGKVVEGMDVVKKVESFGTPSGRPSQIIRVEAAGQL